MRQKVVRNNFFKTPNKPVINYNNPIGIRWGAIKEILDIDDIIIAIYSSNRNLTYFL